MGQHGESSAIDLRQVAITLLIPALVILVVQFGGSPAGTAGDAVSLASDTSDIARPSTVSIAVTGEILPHPSVVQYAARDAASAPQQHDFAPMFDSLRRPLRRADLAICHLEVPVAPPGTPLGGYPVFAIPPEIATGIRATGWDRCSTASNHSNDQGAQGIVATLEALDAAGVGHSGTARTRTEAEASPIVEANGVPVAHLSYTWGFNAAPPAEGWMANVIDPELIAFDAARARAAGAELVVVSMHWGDEYDSHGSPEQREIARRLLTSPDIDLIVGHGPHVVQPIEKYHGKYAFLSVGNLVANQGTARPSTYDGMVATITFVQTDDGTYRAKPPVVRASWYDNTAGRVRLTNAPLGAAEPAWLRSHLEASHTRTAGIVGERLLASN